MGEDDPHKSNLFSLIMLHDLKFKIILVHFLYQAVLDLLSENSHLNSLPFTFKQCSDWS